MTKEEAISRLEQGAPFSEVFDKSWEEALDIAISALKPTCKIDESNFSMEQYRADLQSAYDCGYNKALSENKENIVEDIIAECEKAISEYEGCEVFTYAYGVRDMAQTIKAIAESRLSEFEKEGE